MARIENVYPIEAGGKLRIALTSSNVRVWGGQGNGVRVVVITHDRSESIPQVQCNPDGMTIQSGGTEPIAPEDNRWKEPGDLGTQIRESVLRGLREGLRGISRGLSPEADLELVIPHQLQLEVNTASGDFSLENWEGHLQHRSSSGDVRIRQVRGEASIRTTSGEIETEVFSGPMRLGSTSGDFRLEEITGDIRLETISGDVAIDRWKGSGEIQTVSGDLTLRRGEGPLHASTTSGDLQGELRQCPRLEVSTVSGDLRLELEPVSDGEYEIRTTSGDVRLRLPRDARLAIRAATMSGDISTDLPLTREEASEEKIDAGQKVGVDWLEKGWVRVGHKFRAVLNARDGRLDVKTISGDISLQGK